MTLNEKIPLFILSWKGLRRNVRFSVLALIFVLVSAASANKVERKIDTQTKSVSTTVGVKAKDIVRKPFTGKVTYYKQSYDGRMTASGVRHEANGYQAAHKTLPFGTLVKVTIGVKSVIVKITDRGPFGKGKVLDLSYRAAKDLGIIKKGVAHASMVVVGKVSV